MTAAEIIATHGRAAEHPQVVGDEAPHQDDRRDGEDHEFSAGDGRVLTQSSATGTRRWPEV